MSPHRIAVATIAALVLTACAVPRVFAREGLFVGAGLVHSTSQGDFNGTTTFTDTGNTQTIVAGKPGDMGGLNLAIGYGFNPYIGIELDLMSMGGIGSANAAGFPGKSSDSLGLDLLGARFTVPATQSLDLYAKLGLAGAAYRFRSYRNSNLGSVGTQPGGVSYYGDGIGAGVGAEYFIRNLGLGLGWTQYNLTFDQSSASGISALPKKLHEEVDTVDFLVSYHFPHLG